MLVAGCISMGYKIFKPFSVNSTYHTSEISSNLKCLDLLLHINKIGFLRIQTFMDNDTCTHMILFLKIQNLTTKHLNSTELLFRTNFLAVMMIHTLGLISPRQLKINN